MPKFKLKLSTPVTVVATTEIEVEADNIDDVLHNLEETLEDLNRKDIEALVEYNKDPTNREYPKELLTWSVNNDDAAESVDYGEVELDEFEEVKE